MNSFNNEDKKPNQFKVEYTLLSLDPYIGQEERERELKRKIKKQNIVIFVIALLFVFLLLDLLRHL